jgi:hypothetical protein
MQQYTLDLGKNFKLCEKDYYLICFIVFRMSPPPLDLTIPVPKSPSPPPLIGQYLPTCTIISPVYCALVPSHFHMFSFFLQCEEAATCLTMCEATEK